MFDSATGHFTQLVWASTLKVGVAVSPNGLFVVANYSPPGNYLGAGQFEENVLPVGVVHTIADQISAYAIAGKHATTAVPRPSAGWALASSTAGGRRASSTTEPTVKRRNSLKSAV